MKYLISLLLIIFSLSSIAQFGTVNFIDTTENVLGIEKISTGDFNQDGFDDLVVAQGWSTDRVAYYLNNQSGGFGTAIIVDSNTSNAESVKSGDINNDGWDDIIAVMSGSQEIKWYPNDFGTFGLGIVIDSMLPAVLDLLVNDFSGDGIDDIIIDDDFAILYFENSGNSTFTKTTVTTGTEHYSIAGGDMNNDGFQDFVVGTIPGADVWLNDGAAHFTFQSQGVNGGKGMAVHTADIDGDSVLDVIQYDGVFHLFWYKNDGNGNLTFGGDIAPTNGGHIQSITSLDFDHDGDIDIYSAYSNKAVIFENLGVNGFATEKIVYQDFSEFISEVNLSDVDNDGNKDLVWSAVANELAFHLDLWTTTGKKELDDNIVNVFPNPSNSYIKIISPLDGKVEIIEVISGRIINESQILQGENSLNMSNLKGTYILKLTFGQMNKVIYKKIVTY